MGCDPKVLIHECLLNRVLVTIEWAAADEQWQKIAAELVRHGTRGFGSGWQKRHLHELRTCLQKLATYGFTAEIPREVMDA